MNAKLFAAALVLVTASVQVHAQTQAQSQGVARPLPVPQVDVTIPVLANTLQFCSGIPADQKAAVNEAVSTLAVLPLDLAKPEVQAMAKMMGTKDVSATAMQDWMQARVQYILENNFDLDSHASFSPTAFTYENAADLPDALTQRQEPPQTSPVSALSRTGDDQNDGKGEAQTVMLNIGSAIYAFGKQNSRLVVMDVPGIGPVEVKSPRTGLLEIGPGLFPDLGGHKVQNIALDIFRLGTLFHEARHSDGHGHTLGFMHSNCPVGHDYAGLPACDVSANGPYSIGSSVMKSLMVKCNESKTCSATSAQLLQMIYADQAERTITAAQAGGTLSPDAGAGVDWNDAPEGQR